MAATTVRSPGYVEADLLIECRKIHFQDLDPAGFLTKDIPAEHYPDGDFHRIFIGEIVAITGTDRYLPGHGD
jgi:flavin reductase (DIM6/NTAB) family NADH-FMN oxidoreductase RutF